MILADLYEKIVKDVFEYVKELYIGDHLSHDSSFYCDTCTFCDWEKEYRTIKGKLCEVEND